MSNRTHRDREILSQATGPFGNLFAFFRLSGPGWLQSAITLGGGSLGGALYLGVLGGSHMLWVQLIAILVGVVMLSAISYVALSTRIRPYQAINQYVNPVLGVGWITATILANMIWIMPQFSLCFDALSNSIWPDKVGDETETQMLVSAIIGLVGFFVVVMSFRPGWMSKLFDLLLKLMVGMIVVCFVWSIVYLTREGQLEWSKIAKGFVPDLSLWYRPTEEIAALLAGLPDKVATFWNQRIIDRQQQVIIGTAATAIGINMTFLLPYSMIARGWDKPFRGLARFDLVTAMAIPFVVVTSCIVLASAHSFHGQADKAFLSDQADVVQTSPILEDSLVELEKRYLLANGPESMDDLKAPVEEDPLDEKERLKLRRDRLVAFAVTLGQDERKLAASLVKRKTAQLAASLQPLLGDNANLIFGLGVFAMGFSTIVILMLINSYAMAEILGGYDNNGFRILGAFLAAVAGFSWIWIWAGESKTWSLIVASTLGAILLPIAYLAFLFLMNSRRLLGDEKPQGIQMIVWNVLMVIGVVVAFAQAVLATGLQINKPETGAFVIGAVVAFGGLALVGFSAAHRPQRPETQRRSTD